MLNPEKGIAIFTDGSCNSGDKTGGWAWVAIDLFGNMALGSGNTGDTTVNRMELHAPTDALTSLHEEYGPCNTLVYSDSEYVVLGCNNLDRSRKKNPRWWKRLDNAISLHYYVNWNYVRGHGNNFYNGLADKMAGEARKELYELVE